MGEVRDGKSGEPKGHIEMEMGKTGTWNGVPFRVESSSITVGLSTVENATKWMLNVTGNLLHSVVFVKTEFATRLLSY